MESVRFDTICAPITGNPPSGVSWIRISGPDAWSIGRIIFAPWPEPVIPRFACYGKYFSGDDGLALPFAAGHSYTGEETVELSLHGSVASIRHVIEACLRAGARIAEPGEFTQRAFLNGRIDLSQAEAVREIIDAKTELQLRQATRNRQGALRTEAELIRESVLRLIVAVEASVDFSEEIGEFDLKAGRLAIHSVQQRIERLRQAARSSRIVRNGYRIAIVGPPNAGKSSLMNRLLGTDRSIVTAIPGTTRDYVEETADFEGVPVVLVDTAGLRESTDPIEQIGIGRTREQLALADTVWFVYDGSVEWSSQDEELYRAIERPRAVLANKADIGFTGGPGQPISVRTGAGIEELVEEVRSEVLTAAPEIAVNERQSNVLDECSEVVDQLISALRHGVPDDLLTVLLSDLAAALGRITGQTAEPDMIDRIFHDFCVGK